MLVVMSIVTIKKFNFLEEDFVGGKLFGGGRFIDVAELLNV